MKFKHKILNLLILTTLTMLLPTSNATAAQCSSADRKLILGEATDGSTLEGLYLRASVIGDEEGINLLFKRVETAIKKAKSKNLKSALLKLQKGLDENAGGGTKFNYVPAINGPWTTIQTIIKYNRC